MTLNAENIFRANKKVAELSENIEIFSSQNSEGVSSKWWCVFLLFLFLSTVLNKFKQFSCVSH